MEILEDYLQANNDTVRKNFEELISSYNMSNNVPKWKLFVKLAPDISDERRDFIANGIRSSFRNDMTILLDKQVAF